MSVELLIGGLRIGCLHPQDIHARVGFMAQFGERLDGFHSIEVDDWRGS